MLLTGAPSVGKTQYSLDLGYKLATGRSIWGSSGVDPLRVLVLSLEMDVVEIKYIFEHHARAFDNHELWNTNMRVYCMDDGSFSQYERIIQDFKPDVVIVDSLTELAQEDVKESEARSIMRWFKKMRRKYDCGFIVIHHNRKANDSNKKPRKLSDLYGSFIFAKLSETVVSLWQEENKDYIDVDILKARFGSRSPKRIRRTEHLTFDEVDMSVVVNDTSEAKRIVGVFGEDGSVYLGES
jgi:RecA-family ATPase